MDTKPHDALARAVFGQCEHAAAELAAVLAPAIVKELDLKSLVVVPGSFIDEELRDRYVDLLFTVQSRAGEEVFVYVLLEHQSEYDRRLPLRLLTYQVRIWESWWREHPDATKLPLILPVVLHHGQRPWPGSTQFLDLLTVSGTLRAAAEEDAVSFRFRLDDLACVSDEALRERPMGAAARLTLFVLKNARAAADFEQRLAAFMSVLREAFARPEGRGLLDLVIRYVSAVRDADPAALIDMARSAGDPELERTVVTIAERLIEQGMQKGLEEGALEGRRALLLAQLSQRFGPLPDASVARVRAAAMKRLDSLGLRLLDARSLDEVFRDDAGD